MSVSVASRARSWPPRFGPLAPLVASFVLMAGGLALPSLEAGAVGLVLVLLVVPALVGRRALSWPRLLPGLVGFVSVTWSNWLLASPRELDAAVFAGLRVAFFVLPGAMLASLVDPAELGDELGQRLRLPARPVLATVAALQRVDLLAQDWETIDRARRIRGLGPGRGPIARARHLAAMTFALLVGALRSAERMTVAMEARGYGLLARPGRRRTWAGRPRWRRADTALVVVSVVLAALPQLFRLAG